jgi:hypothetical protein
MEPAIAHLRQLIAETSETLSRMNDTEAASAPPGAWSKKQILGHLLDSAANNHHRFVRAQIENGLSMPGYAQKEWVSTQHYQSRPWTELLTFWTAYNTHLLYVMETTPADRRTIQCRIGADQPVTLEFLMIDYVRHLQHHVSQLLK